MITCEEIYSLHTSKTPESDIHVAYRDIPLDSRNGMRKNDTPLHVACTFADEDAVRILLERGADVNVKNNDGDTPLCVLAKHIVGKKLHLPILPDYCFPKEQECYARGKTRPP